MRTTVAAEVSSKYARTGTTTETCPSSAAQQGQAEVAPPVTPPRRRRHAAPKTSPERDAQRRRPTAGQFAGRPPSPVRGVAPTAANVGARHLRQLDLTLQQAHSPSGLADAVVGLQLASPSGAGRATCARPIRAYPYRQPLTDRMEAEMAARYPDGRRPEPVALGLRQAPAASFLLPSPMAIDEGYANSAEVATSLDAPAHQRVLLWQPGVVAPTGSPAATDADRQ